MEILNNSDICTVIDDRNEKIGKKIRDNELKRIPYLLVVGEKKQKTEAFRSENKVKAIKGV